MNETIYVTGHRNPDSDSICSAITYTDLLNRIGKKAVACRQGPLNEESKFILKRFHQENPLLLTDARTMICDIDIDEALLIPHTETVHHAWHEMLRTQNRSIFVVDENNKLVGICSTTNLSSVRLKPDKDLNTLMATASLPNIAKTIGGKIIVNPERFHFNGSVRIVTMDDVVNPSFDTRDAIVLLSTGTAKHLKLIESQAAGIVLTCGVKADPEVIECAERNSCALIETDEDTMHTARVITESYSIEQVMNKDPIFFRNTEFIDDVAQKMTKSRVRSYPVLDENDNIVGAIARYHTVNYSRRKFVLVDHSAVNQTIGHINEADIVAIIDHHHIGGITTTRPIMYRNVICGCTCTIISNLYQENGLLPDANMSGLLLSAILSDTLNFRSATTTNMDRVAASWLAKRAGVEDIDEYAREMLGASVALKDSSMETILNRDLKNYVVGNYSFAIGQTNYRRMEEVQAILPRFKEVVEKEQAKRKLDLLVMLFTDVMGEGSLFVFYGPLSYIIHDMIQTKFDDHSGFDPDIISRKQQMMPKLTEIIKSI